MLHAGEKRTVTICGGASCVNSEAFKFWQGRENAKNEKEAHSRSKREASSVLFKKKAYFLFRASKNLIGDA